MKLESLRGLMAGEDAVVVGCGPSAELAGRWEPETEFDTRWTIACNRSVRFALPDFAVCVEPARDVSLWDMIVESHPFVIFSHIGREHPRSVKIGGKDVLPWISEHPERLPRSAGALVRAYLSHHLSTTLKAWEAVPR